MKSYSTVKLISKSLIYFAVFALLATAGIYGLNRTRTSADTTAGSDFAKIIYLSPSVTTGVVDPQAAEHRNLIPIGVSIYDGSNPEESGIGIDHISVFATLPGQTFKPANNDAGKATICAAVGTVSNHKPKAPLGSYVGQSTCDSAGNCGSVTWDAPSTVGYHQIFAVVMSSSDDLCKSENVVSWTAPTDTGSSILLYKGEVSPGDILTVSYPNPVVADKEFNIHVHVNQSKIIPKHVDHVSVLVSKKDSIKYEDITDAKICEQAGKSDCLLCFQKSITCPADGNCDTSVPITLNQTGEKRIVAVAISDTKKCTPAGADDNVITKNIEGIITVTSATDPGGTTGTGGSGGSDLTGTPPAAAKPIDPIKLTNPFEGKINSTTDLINKIVSILLYITGAIVVIAIIVGGIYYITAAGNPDNAAKGRKSVTYAAIAIVLAVLVYVIEMAVIDIINRLT